VVAIEACPPCARTRGGRRVAPRVLTRGGRARTGGSSGWQAPEQLISRSGGDARQGRGTDVFSFGLLAHYCLSGGRHAFGESYERDFNILQARGWPRCAHPCGSNPAKPWTLRSGTCAASASTLSCGRGAGVRAGILQGAGR